MSDVIESQEVRAEPEAERALRQAARAVLAHATFGTATHAQMVPSDKNVRRKPRDLSELLPLVAPMACCTI
jgi:hypothetical protein